MVGETGKTYDIEYTPSHIGRYEIANEITRYLFLVANQPRMIFTTPPLPKRMICDGCDGVFSSRRDLTI